MGKDNNVIIPAIACPRLGQIARGRLVPSTCMTGKTFPGDKCTLECQRGHKSVLRFDTLTCLSDLQWDNIVSEEKMWDACVQGIAYLII